MKDMLSENRNGGDDNLVQFCQPVAEAVRRYRAETVQYVKVHRLIDAFEVLVKYLVAVYLFTCRKEAPAERKEEWNRLLAESLARPMLGNWVGYLGALLDEPGLVEKMPFQQVSQTMKKRKGKVALDKLLGLRNRYGHGAVADAEICRADCAEGEPSLAKLLEIFAPVLVLPFCSLENGKLWQWCGEGRLPLTESPVPEIPESPFFLIGEEAISLFPLVYMPNFLAHFFYNSLRDHRKNRIEYLDYVTGQHLEDRESLAPRFLVEFPLHERSAHDPSRSRRQDYLQNFVGRAEELAKLEKFIEEMPQGHFMIWGAPGVGKGALLSRLADRLTVSSSSERTESAAKQILFSYLLSQNDADGLLLMRSLVSTLARHLGCQLKIGSELIRLREDLALLLDEASQGEIRVVLLIDGLDEPLRDGSERPPVLTCLPAHLPTGCLMVLSSRPVPAVQNFWSGVDVEHRRDMTLSGLSADQVREMLCGELNKYEVFSQPQFVERLFISSLGTDGERGNPLFVKLVLEDLREGRMTMDQPDMIPAGLLESYRRLLATLPGQSLDLLYLVAAAKGPITVRQMAICLKRDIDRTLADLQPLLQFLHECEETEDVDDYELFHKSLGDFLAAERGEKLARYREKLLGFCRNWSSHVQQYHDGIARQVRNLPELQHAARYAVAHLGDHGLDGLHNRGGEAREQTLKELMKVIDAADFRKKVFELCGNLAPLWHLVTGVQRELMTCDREGKHQAAFLRYALYLTDEQERFRRDALQRLPLLGGEGRWLEMVNLVEMGGTEREKVFFTLRACSVLPDEVRQRFLMALLPRIRSWLAFESDSKLDGCMQAVAKFLVTNGGAFSGIVPLAEPLESFLASEPASETLGVMTELP